MAPDAEPFLYVEGSSSRVDDIDPDGDAPARFPTFAAVSRERRVVELGPGEALYIPALWFHHVLSYPPGADGAASVAVNVFWRSLPEGEHDPGDLYGNKDPPAARRAAELAARAGAAVANLPEPQRRFYARRAFEDSPRNSGWNSEAYDAAGGDESCANRHGDARRHARDDSTTFFFGSDE